MRGSTFFRFLALVALVAVFLVGGTVVYQAGIAAGLAQAAIEAGNGTTIVVPNGWHGGIGLGGFLLGLIFLFLVFGLFRAVLFGGRRGGHGRWGGPWGGDWKHADGPSGSAMHDRFAAWHREPHGEAPSGGRGTTDAPRDADPR